MEYKIKLPDFDTIDRPCESGRAEYACIRAIHDVTFFSVWSVNAENVSPRPRKHADFFW